MRPLILLALLLLALAPHRVTADPADIAAASRSVVRVVLISRSGGGVQLIGHGSGFAVAPDLVVTNAHVIAPMAESPDMRVGVVPSQGQTGYFAKVVAYSPRNDLALLRLSEKGSLTPATLFTGAVTDGEDVYAVGYPGNVDQAQGLDPSDLMSPTVPVKTRGAVSAGRSSKGFETILHTAPLGTGNSGGPLLDSCGRVIGANSFGTASDSTADSEFYFAVSMREIARFLIGAKVTPRTTGEPCRSIAELDALERERQAGALAQSAELQRAAVARRDAALQQATRQAELEIITGRENHIALAGLALVLATLTGGASLWLGQQRRRRERKLALAVAGLAVIAAPIAWFTRPSISEIDSRAQAIVAAGETPESGSPSEPAATALPPLICVFNPQRSRVTVSDTADVPLAFAPDGCVNGKTQYGPGPDGWARVLAPNGEDAVTVATFDPATRTYRQDRYLLDLDTLTKVRAERARYPAPACGAGEAEANRLADSQAAMRALLPGAPNERLVYDCRPAQ
ncbi:S1C family serine protease [Novosphingobium piscinae]|uniref:Trypsin-like peptidase domain-containing protein n=1 Tax=Novosphingobium piscinae TaxID=1507448 RepID=A0A7X1FX78_9SPHN|nr:serine protease [Novosphingobium piscinae]MBC2668661.1 trypsin-like peptidase domain-containing protein [Novosphingobium piscinae]